MSASFFDQPVLNLVNDGRGNDDPLHRVIEIVELREAHRRRF
jgi:hypothetical protein